MVAVDVRASFWDGPGVAGRAIDLTGAGALIFLPWTSSFTESDALVAYASRCTVRLGPALTLPCTVQWVSGGAAGLEFGIGFDAIKIDKRIFDAAESRPAQVIAIIAAIVALGRDMGHEVVVEGIETEARLEVARVLGAQLGQGYLLTRPMPASRIVGWAAAWSAPLIGRPLTTALGALAFRWVTTRTARPVLPEADDCPISAVVERAGDHVSRLHREYHRSGGGRTPSGLALGSALVALVQSEASAG